MSFVKNWLRPAITATIAGLIVVVVNKNFLQEKHSTETASNFRAGSFVPDYVSTHVPDYVNTYVGDYVSGPVLPNDRTYNPVKRK